MSCDWEGISDENSQAGKKIYVYIAIAIDENTVSLAASQIADSGETSSGAQWQAALWLADSSFHFRRCFNLLSYLFHTTDGLQPESLQLKPNCQYQRELRIKLSINVCFSDYTNQCAEEGVSVFALPLGGLWWNLL